MSSSHLTLTMLRGGVVMLLRGLSRGPATPLTAGERLA